MIWENLFAFVDDRTIMKLLYQLTDMKIDYIQANEYSFLFEHLSDEKFSHIVMFRYNI
jgi:hypothetical protein